MSHPSSINQENQEQPGSLRYHDFVLLMASLDAEWSRDTKQPKQAFDNTFSNFRTYCRRFWNSGARNFRKWKTASTPPRFMDRRLYNPTNWMPMGHADALCLTLADDLDAVQTVIETYKKTVEEVSVGFCPITRSLLPPDISARHRKHFVEPQRLFGIRSKDQPPLLYLARLKMQGVLTLGRALLAQQSLFGLICKRIDESLHTLRAVDSQGLYEPGDLESLRLTFLDLLEEEEIGILFLCSNYSVPMSIISHLQSLTFGDLKVHDPRLVNILESSSHYQKLRDFHDSLQGAQPASKSTDGLCERMNG
ncbi:MAG: hypothetical protein ACAH88_17185, partial [Roseimicrobium sp.]